MATILAIECGQEIFFAPISPVGGKCARTQAAMGRPMWPFPTLICRRHSGQCGAKQPTVGSWSEAFFRAAGGERLSPSVTCSGFGLRLIK